MESSASIPPPGFVPRPASPPDELMTGAPVNRGLLGESRRRLDARRRRIGDYAAGTIVCDVERVGTFRRSLRGGDAVYPLAWLATGVVVLALTATGHTPWSYRVRAERVCASARAFLVQNGRPSP